MFQTVLNPYEVLLPQESGKSFDREYEKWGSGIMEYTLIDGERRQSCLYSTNPYDYLNFEIKMKR